VGLPSVTVPLLRIQDDGGVVMCFHEDCWHIPPTRLRQRPCRGDRRTPAAR